MGQLHEIFLSGNKAVEEDNLIWKEILPEGQSAYTPTPRGPVKRPFRVIKSGKSDLRNGIVSIEELYQNFEDGAFENVGVILGDKPNGDHEDITRNNTGFVRKLRITNKSDGRASLQAGIEFTEPDVKGKVTRGTFANVSSGILGEIVNKHTGKDYNAALKHVAITNTPWIGGMDKFGQQIMASDDDIDDVVSHSLDEELEVVKEIEIKPSAVTANRVRNILKQLGLEDKFAVTEASEEHVLVADKTDNVLVRVALDQVDGEIVFGERPQKEEPVSEESSTEETTTEDEVALSDTNSEVEMPKVDLKSLGIELSDEQTAAVEAALSAARASEDAELERLRGLERDNKLQTKIDALSEVGLSDQPGILKFLRKVYGSTDADTNVAMLADDGKTQEAKSVGTLFDEFLELLKNKDGKINLSDQHLAIEEGVRPADDASEEQVDLADELAAANAILGLPVPGKFQKTDS